VVIVDVYNVKGMVALCIVDAVIRDLPNIRGQAALDTDRH